MAKICSIPFKDIEYIVSKTSTPVQIYDGDKIKKTIEKFNNAFIKYNKNFIQFFAVKATPNPHILKLMYQNGCGFDCSSITELKLVERYIMSIPDRNACTIMYTSNYTSIDDFIILLDKIENIIINLDDLDGLENLVSACNIKYGKQDISSLINILSFRYNPAFGFTDSETKSNILGGNNSKFGMSKERLYQAYDIAIQELKINKFGIHVMTGSCIMNPEYWKQIIIEICNVIEYLYNTYNVCLEFVDIGGGFGIPYHPNEKELDIEMVAETIYSTLDNYFKEKNFKFNYPNIYTESGRYITGPSGYLVGKCQSIKKDFNQTFYGLDATMANLMRPGMYNSYHHITVPRIEDNEKQNANVVGTLCENNDWFCRERLLPKDIKKHDLFVIHDTGAHGHSMGFQYNGKLRAPEVLYTKEKITIIRDGDNYNDLMYKYTEIDL